MKGAKGKGPATRNALKPVDDRKVGKKKAPAKDPNKPKRPASAFFVFMEEFRVTFKKENPYVKFVSVYGKAGGEKWRSMSAAEKAPYEAKAAKRKTEYLKLIKAYNKNQEREADNVEEDSDKSTSEEDPDKSTSALFYMKGTKGKGPAKRDALKPVDDRNVCKKKAPAKEANYPNKTMAANYSNKPKKPASSFFVFMEEFRATFIKENPYVKSPAAVGKAGGRKWKSMSAAEKAPYEAKAAKRKTEYENALQAYNKKRDREADDVEEGSDESTSEEDSDESTSEEEDSDKSTSEVDEESVQVMESTCNQSGQLTSKRSSLPMDNIAQKPRLAEHQSDSHGVNRSSKVNAFEQERDQPFPVQRFGKQHQQQLMPSIQSSVSNYGNAGGSYSSPNMNMSSQSFKLQTHDFTSSSGLQRSSLQPSMHKDQSLMSSTTYVKQEPLDQINDPQHNYQMSAPQEGTVEMMSSRPGFSTSMSKQEPMSVTAQLERQRVSAGNFSLASGSNAKTPQEKPTVGQKTTSEALVSSLSKKQKVSEALSHQSIQLFSGSKEDSQLSEASKTAVQEEERLILQKTHMINCGGRSSDVEPCSSQLLDDDGDVEHLDSNQERRELVENVSSMSDSVDKFASPQSDIICIQGYKVKRSNAPILEAIFKKHGDITANCILKTLSARTYHLEVICEVVRQIQTQDLIEMGEDIECQVSDAEAVNIDVSWIRAHFDVIRKSKKTSENHSLLMAMNENIMLVIQAAEMDRAKRSLKLSAADRCVRVLHLFEQNLDDHILKSKEKIDSCVKHSVV